MQPQSSSMLPPEGRVNKSTQERVQTLAIIIFSRNLIYRLEDIESAESSEVKSSELRDDVWVMTALLYDSRS